jgi:hypothetical protein
MSILAGVAACIAGTFDNRGFRIADCGLQRTAAITGSQISAVITQKWYHFALSAKNMCTMRESPMQIQTSSDACVDIQIHMHGLI